MGISLDLGETKSNISLSLEDKSSGLIWDDANFTWDENDSTWEQPEIVLTKEAKSNINLSLESK